MPAPKNIVDIIETQAQTFLNSCEDRLNTCKSFFSDFFKG